MSRKHVLQLFQQYQGLIGLFILLVVAFAIKREQFYSGENFFNILKQLAVPGTLAIGMTFVILTGGIDLSVGSLIALGNVILAVWLHNHANTLASCLYVVSLCTGIGVLIGWLIGVTKLQPFIVTLAAMVTLRGIAFLYSPVIVSISMAENSLGVLQESKLGLPISGWILIAATVVTSILLRSSIFGRQVYALGGNENAARLSGVRTHRVRMGAFALNGLCVGLAAILFTARTNSGQASSGQGFELDAIAAVVVGGSALTGGVGSILGTFVGALFMGCINTLLQLQGVDTMVGLGYKGLIVLLAVYLQNLGRTTS